MRPQRGRRLSVPCSTSFLQKILLRYAAALWRALQLLQELPVSGSVVVRRPRRRRVAALELYIHIFPMNSRPDISHLRAAASPIPRRESKPADDVKWWERSEEHT